MGVISKQVKTSHMQGLVSRARGTRHRDPIPAVEGSGCVRDGPEPAGEGSVEGALCRRRGSALGFLGRRRRWLDLVGEG